VFIKAVVVTEHTSPLVNKYWADYEREIEFDGNTYEPLHMHWGNVKTSGAMLTEGSDISVSNLGNRAIKYVKQLDISGNPVRLQILHLDLLDSLTSYWQRVFRLIAIRADVQTATFTIGRQFNRNKLPRRVYLKDDFPGLNSDVPRIF
jgi:hypothetical protein